MLEHELLSIDKARAPVMDNNSCSRAEVHDNFKQNAKKVDVHSYWSQK